MSMMSPPLAPNDVSPLCSEMMLLALLAMMRCLPSCAAAHIISAATSCAKHTSFARQGKHHSKTRMCIHFFGFLIKAMRESRVSAKCEKWEYLMKTRLR